MERYLGQVVYAQRFFFCSYFSSLGGRLKAKIKVIYCKIIYEDSDKGGKKIGKNFMTCLDLDF